MLFWFVTQNLSEISLISTNFVDNHTRFVSHNFILNLFFYYWTNFWFLIPIIASTLVFYSSFNIKFFDIYFLIILVTVLLYLFSLIVYWCPNSIIFENSIRKETLNPLLTNSINKYHPFLFYWSLIWVIVLYTYLKRNTNKNLPRLGYINSYYFRLINYLLLNIITLGMGGWWALQEGSWGGWWNWDPSEVFGLLIMLFYILSVHTNVFQVNIKKQNIFTSTWVFYIIFTYLLIQLNFDLVSHNFGTRIHQFVNSYYVYLIAISVILLKLIHTAKNYFKLSILPIKAKNINLNLIILSLLTLFIILSSFTDLLINFVWNLLGLNIFNLQVTLTFFILTLIFLFLVNQFKINFYFLCLFVLVYNTHWLWKIIVLTYLSIYEFTHLHIFLLLWLTLSWTYINDSISQWRFVNSVTIGNDLDSISFNKYFNLKLNTLYVEFAAISNHSHRLFETAWGFLKNTTTASNISFLHKLTPNLFSQILNTFSLEFQYVIYVINYNLSVLPLIFSFIIGYLIYLKSKFSIIIF